MDSLSFDSVASDRLFFIQVCYCSVSGCVCFNVTIEVGR